MPTREGAAVLALAVAVFLLATNLLSGLLFVLDALLVSCALVGLATAAWPLRGLAARRHVPERGVEGEPLAIAVELTARRTGRFLVVEDGWPGARARALVPYVAARAPVVVTVTVLPARRGRYPVGPIEVVCRGMLGLFSMRRRFHAADGVAVWPATRPVPAAVAEQLLPVLEGRAGGRRTRQAEDIYGVRDYQPGDQLARIHWRSTARRGALVVREYERPEGPAAAIVLDLDRTQAPARLDAAVRAAASIFRLAVQRGADVVLMGWEDGWVAHRRWEPAMDWLAGVGAAAPRLPEALAALPPDRRAVVAVASAAYRDLPAGVLAVVPVEEVAGEPGFTGFAYAADGTVHAW
ncbi:MAG: DUF58 domain-containing protein [Armatimonadota bacterium]|nr:DUF58 domain-containing protein [Armatimonadota bacterium]